MRSSSSVDQFNTFVDLAYPAGTRIGLYAGVNVFVGPNGSGKSQALRLLLRALTSNSADRKAEFRDHEREKSRTELESMRSALLIEAPDDAGRSHAVQRLPQVLSVRPEIAVRLSEQLRVLFGRSLRFDVGVGGIVLQHRDAGFGEATYGLEDEASGLLRLASILAAIYDDGIGALLIDEPEATLHPQAQSFLARQLRAVAGNPQYPSKKLVVIATHSERMVALRTVNDVARVSFFTSYGLAPNQVAGDDPVVRDAGLQQWFRKEGRYYKGDLLFAVKPLVVEGDLDAEVLNAVGARVEPDFDVVGAQIIPAGTKQKVVPFVRFLQQIGKSPSILVDLDAFSDKEKSFGKLLADRASEHPSMSQWYSKPLTDVFRDLKGDVSNAIQKHWPGIEQKAARTCFNAYDSIKDSKRRDLEKRRAAFAALLAPMTNPLEEWTDPWIDLHRRIVVFVEALGDLGVFMYTRGDLEAHYPVRPPKNGKREAADREVDRIASLGLEGIRMLYRDAVKALEFAAQPASTDEARAVLGRLLMIAPRLLLDMNWLTSQEELQAMARSYVGPVADLFLFSNRSEGTAFEAGEDHVHRLGVDLAVTELAVKGFPLVFDHCGICLAGDRAVKAGEVLVKAMKPSQSTTESEDGLDPDITQRLEGEATQVDAVLDEIEGLYFESALTPGVESELEANLRRLAEKHVGRVTEFNAKQAACRSGELKGADKPEVEVTKNCEEFRLGLDTMKPSFAEYEKLENIYQDFLARLGAVDENPGGRIIRSTLAKTMSQIDRHEALVNEIKEAVERLKAARATARQVYTNTLADGPEIDCEERFLRRREGLPVFGKPKQGA